MYLVRAFAIAAGPEVIKPEKPGLLTCTILNASPPSTTGPSNNSMMGKEYANCAASSSNIGAYIVIRRENWLDLKKEKRVGDSRISRKTLRSLNEMNDAQHERI